MFIEEIIVADVTSVVLLVILLISRYMTRRYRRKEDVLFSSLIYIGIAAASLELISFLIDGKGGQPLRIVNILANTFLYSCTATISVLWVWYTDMTLNRNSKRIRTIFLPMVVVWGCLILSLIPNAFLGYLFSVDADNVYARQPGSYAFYAFLAISLLISIVLYIVHRVKHGRAQFFPIWMFLTPIVVCVVIQAVWYGISLSWLGCALGLTGIYINIQSKFSLVDGLTGLYNRAYIEHKLLSARQSQRYQYSGIMLDVDYFKEINDTYGHSVGDHALREAARLLLNITDRDSLVFRFAGDEFIVLIRALSNKENIEEKTNAVKERIRLEAEKFNKSGEEPYQIVFSMGHAIYDTSLADDDFFHKMDDEMYKEKQKHHKERR